MSIRCRIRNSYHRGLRDKLLDRKKWHSWWYIKVHINKLPFVVRLEQTISNMHILSTKFSFGLHAGQARSSLIRKSFQVVVQRNLSTSAVVSVILLSIGNKQSFILYCEQVSCHFLSINRRDVDAGCRRIHHIVHQVKLTIQLIHRLVHMSNNDSKGPSYQMGSGLSLTVTPQVHEGTVRSIILSSIITFICFHSCPVSK